MVSATSSLSGLLHEPGIGFAIQPGGFFPRRGFAREAWVQAAPASGFGGSRKALMETATAAQHQLLASWVWTMKAAADVVVFVPGGGLTVTAREPVNPTDDAAP